MSSDQSCARQSEGRADDALAEKEHEATAMYILGFGEIHTLVLVVQLVTNNLKATIASRKAGKHTT